MKDIKNKEKRENEEELTLEEIRDKIWAFPEEGIEVTIIAKCGQSMHPTHILKAKYFSIWSEKSRDEVINSITQVITKNTPSYVGNCEDNFYIECDNDDFKQKLIASIIRNEPTLKVRTNEIYSGTWGYNIRIKEVKK